MKKIVECVPNFSEGRRPEVIDAIVAAIASVQGIVLLDREMNADHNRAVITFLGEPDACYEAAFRGIKRAMELIDLTQHRGEHPRIGATDVCPFVPIANVTNEECIELAKKLARRVAEELRIPTYLYELAATRPERTDLAVIRKGEFEGLRDAIRTDPSRAPDFGPNELHPTAGATVVGVRFPLIAYNINLNTSDIEIARKIAKAIRFRDGGFRYAKALGFEIREKNCVQVSINMTNYTATPLYRVFEAVKREAERYGVTVRESEIVGLTPQQALVDAATWYLQLDSFSNDQILENRLAAVDSGSVSVSTGVGAFLREVAAATPTPGGGSVSALNGALGTALLEMVAGLTVGKKGYEAVESEMTKAQQRLEQLRTEFRELIDRDARAFDQVMAAYRLPKTSDAEKSVRSSAIQEATKAASEVPLRVMELTPEALRLGCLLAEKGNRNSISDVGVGGLCLKTALQGAFLNVMINLPVIKDEAYVADRKSKALRIIQEGRELSRQLEDAVERGLS